jgi:Raf kinase inhibitor-like YbhB/YbcL family protein
VKKRNFAVPVLIACALAISAGSALAAGRAAAARTHMTLTSPAFRYGQRVPPLYTCKGADVSPPLRFGGVPQAAKGLALSIIDTTAHGFTHWTIWNLSPRLRSLSAGHVPADAHQGMNSFGHVGYGGPCPPAGPAHRYVVTLYALNSSLPLNSGSSPRAFLAAVAHAKIATAQLVGFFAKTATAPSFTG